MYLKAKTSHLPFQMWSISLFDVLFTKKLEQDRRTHVKVIKTPPLHHTLSNMFSFVIISWWHWAHLSQKKKQSSHFARHSKGNFCLIFSQQMTIIPNSPVPQDYYDTLPFLLTQWAPLTFVLVILLHSALIYMWHIFGFVCIVYMGTLSWQKGANQYLI